MARSTMRATQAKALVIFLLIAFVAVSVDAKKKKNYSKFGGGATYGQGGNYTGNGLRFNYYARTCPSAEKIVTDAVKAAFASDKSILAGLIRLFFHDCFVNGCDASVLLDGPDVEKLGAPNANSLRGFEVIDTAKANIEKVCKGVVSCADIVSFAARDSIILGGGIFPYGLWLGGRKDGSVSLSAQTLTSLPPPFFNYSQLVTNFAAKGLNQYDMVTLSGAHTMGKAHCGVILARLYNFRGTLLPDPAIDITYLAKLQALCPQNAPGNLIDMEMTTPERLDVNYYKDVLAGKGLFESDNSFRADPLGLAIVNSLNTNFKFSTAFILAMLKMGTIEVKTGNAGNIRAVCNSVTSS